MNLDTRMVIPSLSPVESKCSTNLGTGYTRRRVKCGNRIGDVSTQSTSLLSTTTNFLNTNRSNTERA